MALGRQIPIARVDLVKWLSIAPRVVRNAIGVNLLRVNSLEDVLAQTCLLIRKDIQGGSDHFIAYCNCGMRGLILSRRNPAST